jgi:zinc transport system ATP-binding protein
MRAQMAQQGVPSDPANMLEVEDLAIRFGATEIFHNLAFQVKRGTSLVVIGPNGAGKTVLFKALIGALAYEGIIRWAPDTRIGYIPQKLDIERDLPITGADLLRAKVAVSKAPASAMASVLSRVGLEAGAADSPIGALSGGQFQRVLLAFALIGDPNVLLLDEPAAGVDAPGQQQFDALLRELQDGNRMTIVLISHDLSVVYRHAANILCLSRTYSCFGPPQTVLDPAVLDRIYGMPAGFHVHASH